MDSRPPRIGTDNHPAVVELTARRYKALIVGGNILLWTGVLIFMVIAWPSIFGSPPSAERVYQLKSGLVTAGPFVVIGGGIVGVARFMSWWRHG